MSNSKPSMMIRQNKTAKTKQLKSHTSKRKLKSVAKQSFQKKKPAQTAKKVASPELTYRPRRVDDDPYIISLTREQLGGIHQEAFGQPFPEQQFLRYIQSGAPTVVIEQDGKPIGYYSYLLSPDAKMHVSAMVIDPKRQSSGIGKSVMAQLEHEAMQRGVRTIEVFVQENNAQSLAFTRKLGFQEVFRVEPNTIAFQKQLVPVPVS